jgi:enoyl-CoA hydratase
MAVDYRTEGHVGVITINRPEARNAINAAVASGIEDAIDAAEDDQSIWACVLTGVPPVFSAGADLKAISSGNAAGLATARGGFAGITQRDRAKPMIAAVDGPALAGGTEVVLSCDLVVASTNATFGVPEVKRSLVAAGGGLFRLPRKIPFNVAMECALTGDPIDAARAHTFGLVNVLTAPGDALEAALALANRICANSPVAVRETRQVILQSAGQDEKDGFRLSVEAQLRAMQAQDFTEGMTAFLEKRPPQWTGA